MTNFYEVLGVSQDAAEQELKKTYRSLSLKYHPDRNPEEDAKSKFQAINEAYETLSDPEKRKQYDHQLKFGDGGMPFSHSNSMNEFNDMNNIFNAFFGGQSMHGMPGMPGFGGQGFGGPGIRIFHNGPGGFRAEFSTSFQQPPPPIKQTIELTLEKCYHGIGVTIEYEKWTQSGNNRTVEKCNLDIGIPAGIDEGDTLVLRDHGNINEQMKGELHIQVKIINNTIFKRQGLDLLVQKKISLKEALCGFTFDIPHLNGKKLAFQNTSNQTIIKPGFRKIVPQMGMVREGNIGNMIVELDVEFPESLTAEQVRVLSEVL
jgi:DnaJ-class molecular chaperone